MRRIWIGAVLLAGCWVGLLLAAGCAVSESSATAHVGDDLAVDRDADPGMVHAAEQVLSETGQTAGAGQVLGVIVGENSDGVGSDWLVLTEAREYVLLSTASNCDDDGDSVYEGDLWQLLDPGDLVAWSEEGDDQLVCSGEIEVVRKAAA